MDIEWEKPPEYARVLGSGNRPGKYAEFAAELRQHPGSVDDDEGWAKLPNVNATEGSADGTASNIRRNKMAGFKRGIWETAVHGTNIWVRYLGPKPSEATLSHGDGDEPPDEPDDEPEETHVPRPRPAPAATVRGWAQAKGMEVPGHGRLPESVWSAYEADVKARENRSSVRAVGDH